MTVTYDITGIDEIAKLVITKAKHKTLLFNGEMGAGKTTLIKEIFGGGPLKEAKMSKDKPTTR